MKQIKQLTWISAIVLGGTVIGVYGEATDVHGKNMALSEVPATVKVAAIKAVPGFSPNKAEVENNSGNMVYELKGEAAGKPLEIKLTPDGKILKTKECGKHEDEKDGDKM